MKWLGASALLNVALTSALLLIVFRGTAAPVMAAWHREGDLVTVPHGTPTYAAIGDDQQRCDCPSVNDDAELIRCRAFIRELGGRVADHDAQDLEKVFNGGEPNERLATRMRQFFSAASSVECHDIVCMVHEPADVEAAPQHSDALASDPYYRAMVEAERLGPDAVGRLQRLVRVADASNIDGERILRLWIGRFGPDAIQACAADQDGPFTASLSIDSAGAISVNDVSGSELAACVQQRLVAAVPQRAPLAVRPASLDVEVPNPFHTQ